MARRYWLVKTEPSTYSIGDLEAEGTAGWDGVRNYTARNTMRDAMQVGDLVLVYHSSAKPTGVAGVARVASGAYPDPTQLDPKSAGYDPKATVDAPRWFQVDLEHVETFDEVLPLATLKAHAEALDGLMVIRRGIRFSVQPVDRPHFRAILKLAGARTRVR